MKVSYILERPMSWRCRGERSLEPKSFVATVTAVGAERFLIFVSLGEVLELSLTKRGHGGYRPYMPPFSALVPCPEISVRCTTEHPVRIPHSGPTFCEKHWCRITAGNVLTCAFFGKMRKKRAYGHTGNYSKRGRLRNIPAKIETHVQNCADRNFILLFAILCEFITYCLGSFVLCAVWHCCCNL